VCPFWRSNLFRKIPNTGLGTCCFADSMTSRCSYREEQPLCINSGCALDKLWWTRWTSGSIRPVPTILILPFHCLRVLNTLLDFNLLLLSFQTAEGYVWLGFRSGHFDNQIRDIICKRILQLLFLFYGDSLYLIDSVDKCWGMKYWDEAFYTKWIARTGWTNPRDRHSTFTTFWMYATSRI